MGRWPAKAGGARSLLDQVALGRLDLNPHRLQVLDATVELLGLSHHLEEDPALIAGDIGAADVGHDLELAAELVDHRFLDQRGSEDQLQTAATHERECKALRKDCEEGVMGWSGWLVTAWIGIDLHVNFA